MYINGEWISAKGGALFDVFNPADGDRIGQVPWRHVALATQVWCDVVDAELRAIEPNTVYTDDRHLGERWWYVDAASQAGLPWVRIIHGKGTGALRRAVRIANDADCFALSEASDGAAAGAASVFGVIVGTGTGGGIVLGGELLGGPNAIAGEWGHNPLPWPRDDERPGARCYCGRQGCIETWLSGPALEREYRQNTGIELTAAAIAQRDRDAEPAAVAVLDQYSDRMARSLATVINILDPECIVLGGGVGNIERLYRDVPRCWGRYVFSDRVDTRLLQPKFGDSSGVRGAARLWDERL